MFAYGKSPLSAGYPPMKVEEMTNWFNCNEELCGGWTNKNENNFTS